VEFSPSPGDIVRAWSEEFPGGEPVSFSTTVDAAAGDWADYVRGLVRVLADRGLVRGFDARIESRVPVGSGLSSSAALLIALGRAIREAFSLAIDDLELAVLARAAETDFVGAPVGIMDHLACSLAAPGEALFIDTRSLAYESIPIPPAAGLLVIDSGIRHRHATGDYRRRRSECEQAAAALGVRSLRDVGVDALPRVERLGEPLNRRARHVIAENARVLAAVGALRAGDLIELGRLFEASHESLRDDFEVSTPEIDALVARLRGIPGVYGSRLTGGGFGGSVVALADPARAPAVGEAAVRAQNQAFAAAARVLVPTEQFAG
jgi:galactokinase